MELKTCKLCNRQLPLSEFYFKGTTSAGRKRIASECKECSKKREKERYYDKYDVLSKYKSQCVKCGEKRKYLLEFHHRDPSEKEFTVAHWRKHSKESLDRELQKCDTLCKNCHAEFHYLNKKYGVTYNAYLTK